MDNTLLEKLLFFLLYGMIGAFLYWIFKKKRLFRAQEITPPIPGFYPFLTFTIYFLSVLLSQKIGAIYFPLASKKEALQFLAGMESIRLSFLAILFFILLRIAPKIHRYSIWRVPGSSYLKDLLYALFFFLFVIPLSFVVFYSTETIMKKFFGLEEIPRQTIIEYVEFSKNYPLIFTLFSFSIVILAPIVEEFLFRGFLQKWLRSRMALIPSILVSSLAFTLIHYSLHQGWGNIPILCSLFILAFFLGWIYERRQSLPAAIFLHSLFNTASLLQIFFSGDPTS